MLFMFFQFIICLRIKFLLSVEACYISKFWSGVVHVLVINKRIFHNDDRHETSQNEHENILLLSKRENGYKNLYCYQESFCWKSPKYLCKHTKMTAAKITKMTRTKFLLTHVTFYFQFSWPFNGFLISDKHR